MNSSQPCLLVFADDWGRHPSSCQHLIRRLRHDYPVLWVNTVGTRKPRFDSITTRRVIEKIRNWRRGLQKVDEQMWVLDLPMLPSFGGVTKQINRFLAARRLASTLEKLNLSDPIVLTTLPYISNLIGPMAHRAIVYYVTDDYSHWPHADRDALLRADAQMAERADLVLPVSKALLARYTGCRRCEYLPHGVDWHHFASVSESPPHMLAQLPRPRIGFFGLIYEKLDFSLLSTVAQHFASGTVVMIGPVDYCDSSFADLPNVHFVGKQAYEQLPAWISGLDALMLPYQIDAMILQSGPLKLRECLATGKPTVSVDVPEVRLLQPHVRVASNPSEFIGQLEDVLSGEDAAVVHARRAAVRADDWDDRAQMLRGWLESLNGGNGQL